MASVSGPSNSYILTNRRSAGLPFPLIKDSACQLFCHTIETQTFSDRAMNTSNKNTLPCAWPENCTHVFSMPYFLWNIQSVCNLPMKALFSCHWNCNFLLSALTWSPLPRTRIIEVIRVSYQLPHLVNTTYCFLCILHCSGRFKHFT